MFPNRSKNKTSVKKCLLLDFNASSNTNNDSSIMIYRMSSEGEECVKFMLAGSINYFQIAGVEISTTRVSKQINFNIKQQKKTFIFLI